ncbi:MAG: hypothetical protein H0U96_09155, partial [Acidobacteria bacterium]|nr:hypothetical protein [Acidobacteriota bacterium]
MFEFFGKINVDWMGLRKPLIAISILILLAGLISTIGRQLTPGGTDAFNLGVDFRGGTVITAKFKGQKPSEDEIRTALQNIGITDPLIQASTDKTDEVLIKVPLFENTETSPASQSTTDTNAQTANANSNTSSQPVENEQEKNQINQGRASVKLALDTFGKEAEASRNLDEDEAAAYKIVGTDSVGPIAGA